MARMHARCRGKSGSTHPQERIHPEWSLNSKEIEALIGKMGEKGVPMAEIGIILRDQHGVPDIKAATKKKLSVILKEKNLAPGIPEDLSNLIKKTDVIKAHLHDNPKDLHTQRSLALIQSKIRRLGKYYVREGKLHEDWTYEEQKPPG